MSEDVSRQLKSLLAELEEWKKKEEAKKITREKPRLIGYGFREHEAEAWLEQEPNFDKPIIRRKFTYRRSDDKVPEPFPRVLSSLRLIARASDYWR